MSKWDLIGDIFADDNPAVRRLREALSLRAPETAPEPEPEPMASLPPEQRLTDAERKDRIAALVLHLEAESGDRVAADQLRRLLDGR